MKFPCLLISSPFSFHSNFILPWSGNAQRAGWALALDCGQIWKANLMPTSSCSRHLEREVPRADRSTKYHQLELAPTHTRRKSDLFDYKNAFPTLQSFELEKFVTIWSTVGPPYRKLGTPYIFWFFRAQKFWLWCDFLDSENVILRLVWADFDICFQVQHSFK